MQRSAVRIFVFAVPIAMYQLHSLLLLHFLATMQNFARILFSTMLLVSAVSASAHDADHKKSEKDLVLRVSEWKEDFKIDFGDVLAGSLLTARLTILNDLSEPFVASKVTKSCGCLSSVPSSFSIPPGSTTVIPMSLNAPELRANLGIQFTCVCPDKSEHRVVISGKCFLHFIPRPSVVEFADGEIREILVSFKPSSVGTLTTHELRLRGLARSVGFTKVEEGFLLKGDGSAVDSGDIISSFFVDVICDNKIVETHPLQIVIANRTTAVPSSIQLDPSDEMQVKTVLLRNGLPKDIINREISISMLTKNGSSRLSMPVIRKRVSKDFMAITTSFKDLKLDNDAFSGGALIVTARSEEGEWNHHIPLK